MFFMNSLRLLRLAAAESRRETLTNSLWTLERFVTRDGPMIEAFWSDFNEVHRA